MDELHNYHMVFEDADNDYQITACTLSQYMRGEYGPEYDSEDEEEYEEPQERHYGRDEKTDRKSTRLNSSHIATSRMPSSA